MRNIISNLTSFVVDHKLLPKNKRRTSKYHELKSVFRLQSTAALFVALFVFFLTTFGDSIAFQPAGAYWLNPMYYIIKLLNLISLVAISQAIPYCWREIKAGNKIARRYVMYLAMYILAFFVAWILIYPGNYSGVDEAYMLLGARSLNIFFSWHHVFMIFWYAFGLGFFPSIAAIIFMQFAVISLIAAYITTSLQGAVKGGKWIVFLFLSPVFIVSSLVLHRLALYGILEMLLFIYVYVSYIKHRKPALWVVAILVGFLSAVRVEAIIFIILFPVLIYIFFYRQSLVSKKDYWRFIGISIGIFLSISYIQSLNKIEASQYQVTGMFRPLANIVRGGDYRAEDKQYVKAVVDKAIDYNRIVAGEDSNLVYWSRTDRDISDQDLSNFKSMLVKLIISNPDKYIKGCIKDYLSSNSISTNYDKSGVQPKIDLRFTSGLIASNPYNTQLRDTTLNMLNAVSYDYKHYTPFVIILYSTVLQVLVLIAVAIDALRKRKYMICSLVGILALKNIVIFLTAPMPSFFYYYPLLLTGTGLIFIYALKEREYKNR